MAGRKVATVDVNEEAPVAEAVLSVTAEGLEAFAEAISRKATTMANAFRKPEGRTFRTFRTAEALSLLQISERQFRAWRSENKKTLESYRAASASAGDDNALMHMPLTLREIHRLMDDFGMRPARPAGSRAIRIGIFNFKGGSTKSSTTLHLAVYLAMQGWRTLVVDADPQGSLSTMFGANPEDIDDRYTLGPAFRSITEQDLFDKIALEPLHTHIDGLDLVPANLEMIGADLDIAAAFMRDQVHARGFYSVVSRAFASVEHNYDIILVDGAPAFSFAALSTMWAVDGIVVPMPPASPDFRATGSFCGMLGQAMAGLNARAGTLGREWAPFLVLHNRVKPRITSSDTIQEKSKDVFGRHRIDEWIPDAAVVPNALAINLSVYEATGADIPGGALRTARANYDAVGQRLVKCVRDAWAAGFAKEGSQP